MSSTEVLYEDNHLIAVNKRAGDLVQGDKTGDVTLGDRVKAYLKEKYDKPGRVFLGVVHRLDRPVSGVVVFARTSKALARMNKLFSGRQVQKTYLALVKNPPPKPENTLTHYLKRNRKQNKSYAYDREVPDSKKAVLSYKLIKELKSLYLLEIELHTGRHHQIRAQLAGMGSPIRGDLKYSYPRSNPDGGISLHAAKLSFEHPVKKTSLTLTASSPETRFFS